jgi:hypothetical protein
MNVVVLAASSRLCREADLFFLEASIGTVRVRLQVGRYRLWATAFNPKLVKSRSGLLGVVAHSGTLVPQCD